MSTEYYLISQPSKRKAWIGSIGLSGVQVWTKDNEALPFLKWAITEGAVISLVSEHQLEVIDPEGTFK
jgi:hypothetical protein